MLLTNAGNTGGEILKRKGIITGLLNFEMLVTYLNGANKKAIRLTGNQGKAKPGDTQLSTCERECT